MLVIAYSLSFGPDSLLKTIFKINEGKKQRIHLGLGDTPT